jgi:hypothetical protein
MSGARSMHHYNRLLVMTALSFIAMYVLMYAMVDQFSSVYSNLNQAYMAGLMASPMVLIELLVMGSMYKNAKANWAIGAASVIAAVVFFVLIRQQVAIADAQFLRSMIPHHAGAILMCEKASIEDGEIKRLCAEIVRGQRSEIDQMKARLEALER